jgi:hypothetical protein
MEHHELGRNPSCEEPQSENGNYQPCSASKNQRPSAQGFAGDGRSPRRGWSRCRTHALAPRVLLRRPVGILWQFIFLLSKVSMMPRPSVPRPRGSRAAGPLPGSESANARPNVRREGSGPRLTLAGKSNFPATMICPRKLQASPVPAAPALALVGCRGGLLGLLPEDKGQDEDEKQDALRAVHGDPDQCAAVAPRRVRQREDID